jgi:hypothetical protein
MKVLLDENLPHQLRQEILGHEVFTVAYMGWSGVDNGKQLNVASNAAFDVLLTNDRGLEYDQNLGRLPVAVVVLLATANTMESLRPLLPELQAALGHLQPGEFRKVPST